MTELEKLDDIVRALRAEDGCPWDKAQTHASIKAACIEEAAEVVCGINILEATGKADNLREELGDLLFQVVFHARLAEEEGLFTLDDVIRTVSEKMIRRHPHVFGDRPMTREEISASWKEIKRQEKAGREWESSYLAAAFDEAEELIGRARERKGMKRGETGKTASPDTGAAMRLGSAGEPGGSDAP